MPKKRANGEGSVYKTTDGRVIGTWLDANGKTRYMTSKTMTKREMNAAVRKRLQERDEGIVHDSEGLTVEKYMDRWLESIHGNVRPGTFKPYEAIVRLHVKPTLGTVKLDKLNAMQLEKLYRQKLDSGLSARRVRYIHVTIRKALKDAVRLQLLPRNVADAAIPPRAVKTEIEPLTQHQMRSLLDAARGDNLEALYVLAITTGMRQGELIGLQWKDVDLDSGTLRVNRFTIEICGLLLVLFGSVAFGLVYQRANILPGFMPWLLIAAGPLGVVLSIPHIPSGTMFLFCCAWVVLGYLLLTGKVASAQQRIRVT